MKPWFGAGFLLNSDTLVDFVILNSTFPSRSPPATPRFKYSLVPPSSRLQVISIPNLS